MSQWHTEFRAYARAFGRDEVAAILLRKGDKEWLIWPPQTVEGLTFTLTASAILDHVPVDDLQYVVGWVHSHPMGMAPSPSGTDWDQIREYAKDVAGGIAEMVIFGGHDYSDVSVTRGVYMDGSVFLSDTETVSLKPPASPFDEAAVAFRAASEPPPKPAWVPSGDYRIPLLPKATADPDAMGGYFCSWCQTGEADAPGLLCHACELEGQMYGEGGSGYLLG